MAALEGYSFPTLVRLFARIRWRKFAVVFLLVAALALCFLWPAFLNRSPILFADTEEMIAASLGYYLLQRAEGYSFLLKITRVFEIGFWPAIFAQTFLVLIALFTVGRLIFPFIKLRTLFCIMLPLLCVSALPWFATLVIPDIFTSISCLGVFILVAGWPTLATGHRVFWIFISFCSVGFHYSNPVSLTMTLLCWFPLQPGKKKVSHFAFLLMFIILIHVCVPLQRKFMEGRFYTTASIGAIFLAARLAQDGILQLYLQEHCGKDVVLEQFCATPPDLIPKDANEFLWLNPHPFLSRGWGKAASTFSYVVFHVLINYPAEVFRSTLVTSVKLFFEVYSLPDTLFGSFKFISPGVKSYSDLSYRQFLLSRQFQDQLEPVFSRMHFFYRAAWLTGMYISFLLAFRCKNRLLLSFWRFILLFTVANALTSTISGNFLRYQSRVSWLLLFVGCLFILDFFGFRFKNPDYIKSDSAAIFP